MIVLKPVEKLFLTLIVQYMIFLLAIDTTRINF